MERRKDVWKRASIDEISRKGTGLLQKIQLFNEAELETKFDVIDYVSIPPGVAIDTHRHGGQEECYFIVKGSALMTIDGVERQVTEGDVIVGLAAGESGLVNNSPDCTEIFIFQMTL